MCYFNIIGISVTSTNKIKHPQVNNLETNKPNLLISRMWEETRVPKRTDTNLHKNHKTNYEENVTLFILKYNKLHTVREYTF